MSVRVTAAKPVIANISRRHFAAWPAFARKKQEIVELEKEDVKITKLPNGLTVASLENNSPVSKVGFIVNAGSRYEDSNNLGITHYLRSCAHLTTQGHTTFAITRGIERLGGSLEVTTTREHAIYSVQTLRDRLSTAVDYVSNVVISPSFKRWEVSRNVPRIEIDTAIARNEPQQDLIERIHAAAFRNSLGQSLYCPDYNIGKITSAMLTEFVQKKYTAGNMALVGLGVDHANLVEYGQKLELAMGSSEKVAAKYAGGEHNRCENGEPLTHVIVATEGVSLGSKDLVASGVLQSYLNGSPNIKRGTSLSTSKLNQAVAKATQLPFAANCININYTDSGLFGVYAVTQADQVDSVVKAMLATAGAAAKGVDSQDLLRAKNQFKASLLMSNENLDNSFEDLALQAINTGSYVSPAEVAQQIDAVTAEDVANLAKRLFSKKSSMAAVGNLINTPYLEQLL
ncbi:cytochrome b-c1 complex subunit 2, mitochondrial-like [Glandiceps talaboti]